MRPLDNAFQRVKLQYPTAKIMGPLRDHYGVYAYSILIDGTQFNLCLRRSSKRGLISVHSELTRGKIPILLVYGSYLYVIYPQAILNYYTYQEYHRGALKYQFYLDQVGARELSAKVAEGLVKLEDLNLFGST